MGIRTSRFVPAFKTHNKVILYMQNVKRSEVVLLTVFACSTYFGVDCSHLCASYGLGDLAIVLCPCHEGVGVAGHVHAEEARLCGDGVRHGSPTDKEMRG